MPNTSMIATFQDLYFADADPEALNLRGTKELKSMAEAHWALLQESKAGEVQV
jgi:glutamate dehydrogenase